MTLEHVLLVKQTLLLLLLVSMLACCSAREDHGTPMLDSDGRPIPWGVIDRQQREACAARGRRITDIPHVALCTNPADKVTVDQHGATVETQR